MVYALWTHAVNDTNFRKMRALVVLLTGELWYNWITSRNIYFAGISDQTIQYT